MEKDYTYEVRMGEWVAERCKKRADHVGSMPDYVKEWLDHGGKSPADRNTAPPASVQVWLAKTIDDPDWPERQQP